MTVPQGFGSAAAAAIARAAERATRTIAREVPRDVHVGWSDGAIRLSGHRLAARSLVDARLRDFAAAVRTGQPR